MLSPPDHGRIETRRIWCSVTLNGYLDFPYVGQVFLIEREVLHKKSARRSMAANRGHWTIENRCHDVIDWNFDEDRSRIHTGYGPQNVTRLRRFAVGVLTLFCDAKASIAERMAKLNRNTRMGFDYLRMTENSTRRAVA